MRSAAVAVSVAVLLGGSAMAGEAAPGRAPESLAAGEARLEYRPLRFDEPPEEPPASAAGDSTGLAAETLSDLKQEPADGAIRDEDDRIPFGRAGSEFLTFGGGVAADFRQDVDFNLHVAWSHFVADELEFAVEGGGWYFHQTGDDTVGLNGSLIFRWHFLHPQTTPDEEWDWTVYTDVGMGLMGAFDNVPADGTGFVFTPRAGFGFTKRIADDGTRLQTGVRWAHVSNGRIEGDMRNPSRDSVMVYAGVIIPF